MTSAKKPEVFIIVLNWNGWKDTLECLYSLKKLHYTNYKMVVVDNASTDESIEKIQNEFPDMLLLQIDENKGYAAGNNAGIRYALDHGADYVWILNNDTVVDERALQPLVQKMENNQSMGMCGSLLVYYQSRNKVQALGGGHYYKGLGITKTVGNYNSIHQNFDEKKVEYKLDFIVGASVLVSQAFIDAVGLMNEDYFLFYEEIDWATRGRRKAFTLGFASQSIVYHKHGASINSGGESNQKRSMTGDYYQVKNRLRFSRNFFPYCLPTVYLTVIYAFFKRLIKGQWERAAMILKLMVYYNR